MEGAEEFTITSSEKSTVTIDRTDRLSVSCTLWNSGGLDWFGANELNWRRLCDFKRGRPELSVAKENEFWTSRSVNWEEGYRLKKQWLKRQWILGKR